MISRSLLGAQTSTPAELEACHRARLEKRLDQVVETVTKMAQMIGQEAGDDESVNMEADIQHSLTGEAGERLVQALQGVAQRVEAEVPRVVAGQAAS